MGSNNIKQYVRSIDRVVLFITSDVFYIILYSAMVIVFLPWLKLGFTGYIMATLAAGLLRVVFMYILSPELRAARLWRLDLPVLKEMLQYSVPAAISGLAWWLVTTSNRFFILHFLGEYYNGIYAMANKIANLIVTANTIFLMAWNMSSIKEKDNNFSAFFSRLFEYFSTLQFAIMLGILAVLDPVFRYLIDPQYSEAAYLVPVLMLSVLYYSFLTYYGVIFIAYKKSKDGMYITIVVGIAGMPLNYILIRLFDLLGIAIAVVFIILLYLVLVIFYVERFMKTQVNYFRLLLNLCICSAGMVLYMFIRNELLKFSAICILFLVFLLVNIKTAISSYKFAKETLLPLAVKKLTPR